MLPQSKMLSESKMLPLIKQRSKMLPPLFIYFLGCDWCICAWRIKYLPLMVFLINMQKPVQNCFQGFFLAWIRYISFFEILLADCCSKNKWSFCELRRNSEVISNQNRMINNNHNTLTWYFSKIMFFYLIFLHNSSRSDIYPKQKLFSPQQRIFPGCAFLLVFLPFQFYNQPTSQP